MEESYTIEEVLEMSAQSSAANGFTVGERSFLAVKFLPQESRCKVLGVAFAKYANVKNADKFYDELTDTEKEAVEEIVSEAVEISTVFKARAAQARGARKGVGLSESRDISCDVSCDVSHDSQEERKEKENPPTPLKEKEKKEEKKEIYKERNEERTEKADRFIPPTVEMVKAYCVERLNGIDASQFVSFYTSKGWMIGKNKMKDWKAAVRTWETNGRHRFSSAPTRKPANVIQGTEAQKKEWSVI